MSFEEIGGFSTVPFSQPFSKNSSWPVFVYPLYSHYAQHFALFHHFVNCPFNRELCVYIYAYIYSVYIRPQTYAVLPLRNNCIVVRSFNLCLLKVLLPTSQSYTLDSAFITLFHRAFHFLEELLLIQAWS
jgi:hypothetical protein